MGQRDTQKAKSRAAILGSAAALLRQGGGDAASVQRAMKGAGLTVGAFYAHFDDKAALIDAAFETAIDEMAALVSSQADTSPAGSPGIAGVIDQYLSTDHRDQPERGCPLPALLGEAAHQPATIPADRMAEGVTRMCDAFRAVDPDLTEADALALLTQMIGAQIVSRALRGSALSDEVLAATRTQAIAGLG